MKILTFIAPVLREHAMKHLPHRVKAPESTTNARGHLSQIWLKFVIDL
jgi:hypothetical protein